MENLSMEDLKRKLNHHIDDYLRNKSLKSSEIAFSLDSNVVNEKDQVKVIPGALESRWELFSEWCLLLTDNTYLQESKKHAKTEFYDSGNVKANPAKAARLNAYLLSYMRSESFTDSAAAFAKEAGIMEDSSLQDALFSKFWIPVELRNFESSMSESNALTLLQQPTPLIPLQDLSFREVRTVYKDTSFRINTCHFSEEGKLLAFGGTDRMVSVWDMDSSMMLLTTPKQPNVITEVRFQPHSTSFAFSCVDKLIRLCDAKHTGTSPPHRLFHGHTFPVMSLDFCPSKPQILCSCDNQGEIRFWDVISGNTISHLDIGKILQIQLDCRAGQIKSKVVKKGDISSKVVRFQSEEMVAAAVGSRVMMFSIDELECTDSKVNQGHVEAVKSICWDPSGAHLASVSADSARVWSLNNGSWTNHYSLDSGGHKFEACEFHPRHPSLLLIGSPQYIHVWDFTHGDETRIFLACTGFISALTASPERELIACSSRDSEVKLWK